MSPVSTVFTYLGVICLSRQPSEETAAVLPIDFVYFRNMDCQECSKWETADLRKLDASPLFRQVQFTQVTKGLYPFAPSASAFPDEICRLKEIILENIGHRESPLFAILMDGTVVASWTGASKSVDDILALIERQKNLVPNFYSLAME